LGKKQRQRLVFLRYKRHKILNKKHNIKQPIKPNKMTPKEVKTFTTNCSALIEHARVYGIPRESSHFVIDKMMAYRLKYISENPEKLQLAKKIDKKGILFN
jgi:hypothetical protein